MMWVLAAVLFSMLGFEAKAGLFEIGFSGSLSESQIQESFFSQSESLTGSISYYFWERSAIQLSGTLANRRDRILSNVSLNQGVVQIVKAQVFGIDFVMNPSARTDLFQPFFKIGFAQMEKIFTSQTLGLPVDEPITLSGVAPSGGLGVRLLVSQSFSLHISFDAWALPQGNGLQSFDTRLAGGVSWFL